MGRASLIFALALSVTACGRVVAGSTAAPTATPSAAPTVAPTALATPAYVPSPGSLSGRVVRLTSGGIVIDQAGTEFMVDLKQVVEVWRETSVPASAIAVGDDLFIAGIPGTPFIARNVWANIGRIDGLIRAIDATGMDLDVQPRAVGAATYVKRIDFSVYVEFGAGDIKTTRADLVVGRSIGAVVYRPPTGELRATRVWLW